MSAHITDRSQLRTQMIEFFSEADLKILCYELQIDYEVLDDGGKANKARALIEHCEDHFLLSDLAARLKAARPQMQVPIQVEAPMLAINPVRVPLPQEATRRGIPVKALSAGAALLGLSVIAFLVRQAASPDVGLENVVKPSSSPSEATIATAPPPTGPAATTASTNVSLLIDDFEQLSEPLDGAEFSVNTNGGNNGSLSLTNDSAHVGTGQRALRFAYTIVNSSTDPGDNYIGFERNVSTQDWSKYSELCAWLDAGAASQYLALDFRSGSAETSNLVRVDPDKRVYCVPLRPADGKANLQAVTSFALYMGAPFAQSSGTIYIDHIGLR
jgi:hypothetical protein